MSRKGCDNPTPKMLKWRANRARLKAFIDGTKHTVPVYRLGWPAPRVES